MIPAGNQRYYILATAFAGAMLLWIWPILQGLHQRWSGAAIEYGYAPVAMALILIVLEARKGWPPAARPSLGGVVALTAAVLVVTLSRAAEVVIVPQLMLPPTIMFGIWSIAGFRAALRFAVPLAFLYFVIPFWQVAEYVGLEEPWLAGILRDITTVVVSFAISLSGIPALVQGDLIMLPSGVMQVAEGCSGRSYFIVALELSLFYAIGFLRSWNRRLALVAAAAALAMAGNWIRVFLLVLVGYYSEMTHPLVDDHAVFGWVVFLFVIAPLMLIGRWLENGESNACAEGSAATAEQRKVASIIPATGIGVLCLGIFASAWIDNLQNRVIADVSVNAPAVAHAEKLSPWVGDGRPVFPDAPGEVAAIYRFEDQQIGLYIARYPVQRQRVEVVHFGNRPEGAADTITEVGTVTVGSAEHGRYQFRRLLAEQNGSERALLFGMQIAGESTANETMAKLLQLQGIARGRTDAAAFVFSIRCDSSCDDEWSLLSEFASLAMPAIEQDIGASADDRTD